MATPAKPIPEGYSTVTPHLVVRGASKAIEFYKKAFGAEEMDRMPGPDGRTVMHATLKIGKSLIMLCDEFPQMERWVSPQKLNGTTIGLHIYTENVDKALARAVAAGAKVSMPVMDTFWGDRYGRVTDPFGHEWSMATRKQDLTPAEIQNGAQEFFNKMPRNE
jgi:PhnB protein